MDGNVEFSNPNNTVLVTKMNASMENGMGRTSENNAQFEVLAPSDCHDIIAKPSAQAVLKVSDREPGRAVEEVNVDWFEPLEEDNDEPDAPSWDLSVFGRRQGEEESLAGESERSGSEWNFKRTRSIYRRKRVKPDEGWEDWPILGDGWKRKTVIRRSGSSMGQMDVYYLSPQNERVRSRVELGKVLDIDLSMFEYKLGTFSNCQPARLRRKKMRKDRSPSSESISPISNHRLTPGPTSRVSLSPLSRSALGIPDKDPMSFQAPLSPASGESIQSSATKLPWSPTSRPTSSLNGLEASNICFRICTKCGNPYTVTESERQGKKSCCLRCKVKKPVDNRNIVFRKWIPCGQCVACLTTVDCGMCASCKQGMLFPDSRKPVRCRKRKCIWPIHKSSSYQTSDPEDFSVEVDVDGEEDDFCEDDEDYDDDDDDDEEGVKKRKRRACGQCQACLSRKDCGTCDFCVDKPKFGGSNKKRQKCRLRQCQRQAMLGLGEFGAIEGTGKIGRPRHYNKYSRKKEQRKRKPAIDPEMTNDVKKDCSLDTAYGFEHTKRRKNIYGMNRQPSLQVDHDYVDTAKRHSFGGYALSNQCLVPEANTQERYANAPIPAQSLLSSCRGAMQKMDKDVVVHSKEPEDEEEDEVTPMITQIFSLAETSSLCGSNMDHELLKLLEATRKAALPILWYAIMMEGPQLQLVQCSKMSTMTDTVVQINPGFCYQVAVQGQPLLLTHPLYEGHPPRMTSVTLVVNLLLDLERYRVCQGVPDPEPSSKTEPFICERASTCDFLILKDEECCKKCSALTCL
ncbi:methyl-CpG-binding domain protein 1b isoform X3 [Osmerus eperlanus]|uniref:methyl-CpG-binding domain protein 1b isoform X3 n=1 Tax=Osmerus eperlanus TaxID=29151 RepID=UPI002E105528